MSYKRTPECDQLRHDMGYSLCPYCKEVPDETERPIVLALHIDGAKWDVTVEAVAALRALVLFTNNNGERCFCDQWKDPSYLQHSGACLNAQDVLRRADSL